MYTHIFTYTHIHILCVCMYIYICVCMYTCLYTVREYFEFETTEQTLKPTALQPLKVKP